MMTKFWVYGGEIHPSKESLDAAVLAQRDRLENNPTTWAIVKEVVANDSGGWHVLPEKLTDSQIKNLDFNKRYNVSSIYTGETNVALDSVSAAAKVSEYRAVYALRMEVNTIYETDEPRNVSMAEYVS
jgi:hypothetical protein